jgi:serine-type D-Ala-D-Ala carboxypeptidase/endopeptidase (penicillin-binding protein 4)
VSIQLLLVILTIGSIKATAQPLPERLQKVLKAYSVPKDHLGLAVIDLSKTPHPVEFGLNEKDLMTPASITKILTAAAVLQKLGPSFKFQTTLWSAGSIKDGVLNGDLVLKGGGDPGFVSETMWFLVNELVRTGIKKVEGNVIVDDTDFDAVRADPSRDPERVDRAYDAPVGAMSFNWNSINIFVRPTQVGEAPLVHLDPIGNGFSIVNKAKTVNKAGTSIDISRDGNKIFVSGTIGVGQDEKVTYKNIDDPAEWAGQNLVFFLGQRGITVSGKMKTGKKPEGAKLLAKADSKAVSASVTDMMKFSNNFVAEMLTKNLAAQAGVVPATIEGGMKIIRSNLVSMGVDEKNFNLVNPSGLSRKNKMRPVDLAQVLTKSYENFPTSAEFLTALPLAGIDGTLKSRMKNPQATGWVRAKTGLLNGVVGLAGFAGRKDGSIRAFAFIFNGKAEQGDLVRRLFDQLATELVQ